MKRWMSILTPLLLGVVAFTSACSQGVSPQEYEKVVLSNQLKDNQLKEAQVKVYNLQNENTALKQQLVDLKKEEENLKWKVANLEKAVSTSPTPEPSPLPTPTPSKPSGRGGTSLPAYQPITHNIKFTAVDNDDIKWDAGTINCADGTVFTVNAGSLNLANASPYYLYYDTVTNDNALDSTQTFGNAIGASKILVAFASVANQKALITSKGG